MITLENVHMEYANGTKAIRGVNVTIEGGEFVFIVGDSGCGKTTLVKLLLKEIDATKGSVIVDGQVLGHLKNRALPKYRRKLGVVFQDFRLLKDRNVFENVAFAQRVIATPIRQIRRRVPQVLTLVGLSAKYKSYPKELSGGEQQRVAIARALVNAPDILIADEPTGNMDPDNAWQIMSLLDRINKDLGTTVVVVTHSREIVDRMKKRVIAIERGVIISDREKGGYIR